MIKLIKRLMTKIEHKRFVPDPAGKAMGEQPMTKEEVVESLMAYKAQNPTKYEQKKEALFARYGLSLDEEVVVEPDENDKELVALKKALKTKA